MQLKIVANIDKEKPDTLLDVRLVEISGIEPLTS